MTRPVRILIGLLVGTICGLLARALLPESAAIQWIITYIAQPAGQIFLRLILMVVVPLVFSSLVLGVVELGDLRRLGRVGYKTLIYTLFSSVTSVLLGIGLVYLFQPGRQLDPDLVTKFTQNTSATGAAKVMEQAQATSPISQIIVGLIPRNPLQAAVNALEGDMIALMVFALIFAAAFVMSRDNVNEDPLTKLLESIRDVSMRIVDFAMSLAPYGVAGLMFAMTARFGWDLLLSLGQYVFVVLGGLAIQQYIVFGLVLWLVAQVDPRVFFRAIREVMIQAFSTASSNATLPTSIRVANEKLKLNRSISSFVLTVGATANQNGTALFEGITILFLAQVFGVDLSFGQQFIVMMMSVLAGVGTAGVPGGSIPLIVIVMQSVGIPPEGIGLILGVDRLLDMCRTMTNVSGDLVAAQVIDSLEKRHETKQRTKGRSKRN